MFAQVKSTQARRAYMISTYIMYTLEMTKLNMFLLYYPPTCRYFSLSVGRVSVYQSLLGTFHTRTTLGTEEDTHVRCSGGNCRATVGTLVSTVPT